jgi:antitoxin ParD1/3/4
MEIVLNPAQENFVVTKLQEGKYESVDALMAKAFQLLEENEQREQELATLRENIAAGAEQIHQGKVVEGERVFQQLQSKLDRLSQD